MGNQFWQFSVPLLKCFPDPLQPPIHERIRNKLSKVLDYSSHDNKYSIEIDKHRQMSVRTQEHKYAGVGLRRRISSLLLNTLTVCRDNLCSLSILYLTVTCPWQNFKAFEEADCRVELEGLGVGEWQVSHAKQFPVKAEQRVTKDALFV